MLPVSPRDRCSLPASKQSTELPLKLDPEEDGEEQPLISVQAAFREVVVYVGLSSRAKPFACSSEVRRLRELVL